MVTNEGKKALMSPQPSARGARLFHVFELKGHTPGIAMFRIAGKKELEVATNNQFQIHFGNSI